MKLTLSDFSGGITDTPFSGAENCGATVDNFLINKDKSIEGAPGIDIYSTTAYRVPTNKRISLLKKLSDDVLVAFSAGRAFIIRRGDPYTISELYGPTGNKALKFGDETSIVSAEFFNNQLHVVDDKYSDQIKIYLDGSNTARLRTAGLPPCVAPTTIVSRGTDSDLAGTNNFLYAFVYSYEYYVGTTRFVDMGAPVIVPKSNMTTKTKFEGMSYLMNGSGDNYDFEIIKIRVFRTTNNGTAYYHLGDIPYGTTSIEFEMEDGPLSRGEGLYTNGGIVNNDKPSPAKYIFESNDTYYTLNIKQDTQVRPFRLKQSITNDPDSVPDDFFLDFKGTLRGGVGIGRSPIVFTENQTVRLDGIIDETGQGNIQREVISHTVGAASHNGIVKTSKGVYFPSFNDGFYFTDGYSTPTKLAKKDAFSSKIDSIYKNLVSSETKRSRIQGAYDAQNNRVYWTVQEDASDNDKIYVYDETHDAFTTLSNTGGISPTSLVVDGEKLIIGDAKGYLFVMSKDFFNFPVVNTEKLPSQWDETPIIYSWKSIQFNGGDGSINKWFNKINVQGNPETSVSMAIRSYANGEDTYKDLTPISMMSTFTWGDFAFAWGNESFVWNRVSTMNQTRRFPYGRLRARQRQIEFTNAYVEINSNTDYEGSYVTINPSNGIVVLVDPDGFSFGLGNEGYDFLIGERSYRIISNPSGSTLKLDDSLGTLALLEGEFFQWKIMGQPKNQRPHILNLSIEFEMMSDAGTAFRRATDA